jgi:hypothetical protein
MPKKNKLDLEQEFKDEIIEVDNRLIDSPDYLLNNYIMLHGTNCVWDISTGAMMKVEHIKMSFPMSYKIWQSNPTRQIIPATDLVFSPKGVKHNQINMFTGIKMIPTYGNGWKAWHMHLLDICNNDTASVKWITSWFAYMLQNIGSKMRTSLVIYGDEGTGKNILVNAIKEIFGQYGDEIGQSQIESQFNAWASCKLFLVANEVVSRRERRHIKGKLKQLITEPFVYINQKSMPERVEPNFANFVFLSNEDVPIDASERDRRFHFTESTLKDHMTHEHFTQLKKDIIVSDLYGYLLSYNYGDFNEHTKPLLNDAKQKVLDANLPSEQAFMRDWLEGKTMFPVETVSATTLYWAYKCWAAENGETYTCTQTTFGRVVGRIDSIIKAYVSIKFTSRKITVYFMDRNDVTSSIDDNLTKKFDDMVLQQKMKYKL